MNLYYLDGNEIIAVNAYKHFRDYSPARYEGSAEELAALWDSCQTSEDQRDLYLPDGLEIVGN